MKILHFIDEIKMGGAQTHLLTIISEMKRQRPDDIQKVVVLFEEAPLINDFRDFGIEVECLNLRSFFQTRSYFQIIKLLKNYIKQENTAVVETHLTWSRLLANTAAYFAGIKTRIGFEQGDIYLNSFKFRITNFFSQFFFQDIIVCSDQLKEWTNKTHRIFNSKLKVMYNCVDLSKYRPIENKNLESFINIPPKYPFITVGTLGKGVNKRIDISIEAISVLKNKGYDVGLIICGDGDQRVVLENLAVKLKVASKIFFLGMRSDVANILPNCYAFVHAAPYEPFGIVCIEAMACGLPAIVPNSGGIQNIVSNNIDGYVYEKLNKNKMAEKMEIMINNKNYNDLSNQAILKVKNYDVKNYVNSLYKLYDAK
jgi:glycosyltransferase involved in cell wall biosynthesis